MKIIKDFSQGDYFLVKISHNPTKNIAGMVFRLVLKKHESSNSSVLDISYTAGTGENDSVADGLVYIPVTVSDTENIPAGKYFGTLKRIDGDKPFTLARSGRDGVEMVEVFENVGS